MSLFFYDNEISLDPCYDFIIKTSQEYIADIRTMLGLGIAFNHDPFKIIKSNGPKNLMH